MVNKKVIIGTSKNGDRIKILESKHINNNNNMTKKQMVEELVEEFYRKQGYKKARWVRNKLNRMSRNDVFSQYVRLKDNISYNRDKMVG